MSGKIMSSAECVYNKNLGQILRQRQTLLGLSQRTVANFIGVTHQQYQKYEIGENTVSAYRLVRIKEILEL